MIILHGVFAQNGFYLWGETPAESATEPFILRRLKTDKTIISDLPEKMEMKVFCTLTREQASLYKAVVDEATRDIEQSEGIQRKGIVLATLSKLKQVCNHREMTGVFTGFQNQLRAKSPGE